MERARARSLLDTLYASAYSVTLPVLESVREAYARNQREAVAQQALLANNDGRKRGEITEKLQQLYRQQEGLESQMRSGDDKFASLLGSRTATVEQVQRNLLDQQSAVLSYWIGAVH